MTDFWNQNFPSSLWKHTAFWQIKDEDEHGLYLLAITSWESLISKYPILTVITLEEAFDDFEFSVGMIFLFTSLGNSPVLIVTLKMET